MKHTKKILIIGGEGFIGKNIADVVSESFVCYSLGNIGSVFSEKKGRFIEADPYVDPITEEFDAYVHLIDNNVEPGIFEEKEKELMRNIGIKKGKHLIVFSSAVVYADPESPYGQRKLLLEKIYEEHCEKNGINLTILRLFNTYGKYQIPYRQGSLVANIFFNYLNSKPIEINDMSAKRDFVYAEDVGKIVKWTIENEYFGKNDLASGKLVSLGELLEYFKKHIFVNEPEIIDKNKNESNACPEGNCELYGKIKHTQLEDGLKETLRFYESNIDKIKKYIND